MKSQIFDMFVHDIEALTEKAKAFVLLHNKFTTQWESIARNEADMTPEQNVIAARVTDAFVEACREIKL